jgi:hypothetical protein
MQQPLDPVLADYKDRWSAFGAVLFDIATRLQQLPPDTVWPIDGTSGSHIGDVALADFAQKFANISWTLTDKDYSALNGGVGEVVSHFSGKTWTGAAEEIRASDFATYMAWPDREGAIYLALHETAHVTALGLQMNSMLFDLFLHQGGDPRRYANTPFWTYNEAVANEIAATVARAIDLPSLPTPTGGFPTTIIRSRRFA